MKAKPIRPWNHPLLHQNKLKQVGDECQPTLSKLPIPSFLGRYNTERVFTLLGILYNCTPGLTITFTVMTQFLRKLQQFTLGRCTLFAALLVAAIPCSFRTHSKNKKIIFIFAVWFFFCHPWLGGPKWILIPFLLDSHRKNRWIAWWMEGKFMWMGVLLVQDLHVWQVPLF